MAKSQKVVLQAVTVWHVNGNVKLTKCNNTGKWIKNAIGQVALESNDSQAIVGGSVALVAFLVFVLLVIFWSA